MSITGRRCVKMYFIRFFKFRFVSLSPLPFVVSLSTKYLQISDYEGLLPAFSCDPYYTFVSTSFTANLTNALHPSNCQARDAEAAHIEDVICKCLDMWRRPSQHSHGNHNRFRESIERYLTSKHLDFQLLHVRSRLLLESRFLQKAEQ